MSCLMSGFVSVVPIFCPTLKEPHSRYYDPNKTNNCICSRRLQNDDVFTFQVRIVTICSGHGIHYIEVRFLHSWPLALSDGCSGCTPKDHLVPVVLACAVVCIRRPQQAQGQSLLHCMCHLAWPPPHRDRHSSGSCSAMSAKTNTSGR